MDNDFMVGSGFEVNDGVIISKLDIKDGDTIIVTIDTDKYDLDEAYHIFKLMVNSFPDNKVVTTFKGVEIAAAGTTSSENS